MGLVLNIMIKKVSAGLCGDLPKRKEEPGWFRGEFWWRLIKMLK